ncbi:MAG TPA: hypothetical protein VHE61_19925, partial [Opitutaceae bacterium]|nr:hypothetical protein [Opitutaceae bacterium]
MKLPVFLLGAFGLLLAGCTSVTVQRPPTFNPARYQHIFVERPFNENHHVDEIIVNELKAQGRDATSGPLTMLPDNADAIV